MKLYNFYKFFYGTTEVLIHSNLVCSGYSVSSSLTEVQYQRDSYNQFMW